MIFTSRFFLVVGLVLTGMLSRLIPHPPNFTPLNAIALFGAFYFGNRWTAFAVVSLTMLLSDLVIGFYPSISFIYLSFGLITAMGSTLKKSEGQSLLQIPKICVASSFLFFFVTNFGDWLMLSIYPKTMEGLAICYFAGIPFLTNQVLGDLTYGILFFGLFELSKKYLEVEKQRI